MTLKNRNRFLKKLAKIQGLPRQRMRAAAEEGAKEVTEAQRRGAARISARLAHSVGYTFGSYSPDNANVRGMRSSGDGDADLTIILHAGDRDAFFAGFFEHGTAGPYEIKGHFAGTMHPGLTPQPFFYPPFRALRRRVMGRITRAGRKALRDGARS